MWYTSWRKAHAREYQDGKEGIDGERLSSHELPPPTKEHLEIMVWDQLCMQLQAMQLPGREPTAMDDAPAPAR